MTRFRKQQQAATSKAATEHFSEYVIDPSLDTTAEMKIANDYHLNKLYEKVKSQTKKIPNVPAPEVAKSSAEMLERFPSVFESIQDTHIKKILNNAYKTSKDKITAEGLTETPTFSFNDLWTLRKGIGQEIRRAKIAGNEPAESAMGAVYSAVSRDMDNMLSGSVPQALQEFKEANQAFQQYSVKFDALRTAYDRAMGTTSAKEMFSPKTYSTELKKLANDPNYKKNVHWTPNEVENMTGLANIMQVAKRGGQFKENVPTGNRFLDFYLLKAASHNKLVLPSAWLATFLTTTKLGKNLITQASKIEPTSTAMGVIMKQIYQQAPKVAISAGTNP
jgi:hypothetical protein